MHSKIRVQKEIIARLMEEARRVPAEECCGLLAGRSGVISAIFPAKNALSSPSAYEIAPEELFRLVREIRAAGLDMMGIFHSHPTGENRPSARDSERAYYPDAAYFIVSPQPDAPQSIRAFSIRDGRVAELAIEMLEPLRRIPG
jgi:proteasome lid subunit RPN8/RPN11